ncbi:MAG: cell division protein ZapE [Candidatus Deianiraeaceae bacterium]
MGRQLNEKQSIVLHQLLDNKKKIFRAPQSFYIHGNTGCGKTTIMEEYLWVLSQKKLHNQPISMHFHDYILDISKLLTKNSPQKVAKSIAKKTSILCFDEFFIDAIADAKILYDILLELVKLGMTIVLTSNFSPNNLYKEGFNREIIFPQFSDFLYEKMNVIDMASQIDYRTQGEKKKKEIAFNTLLSLENAFKIKVLSKNELIQVDKNHTVQIAGTFTNGVIVNYDDIFKKYTSIKDYRKLARTFTHIHISIMNKFNKENEDEAIRFRNFIDILYTRGMICSFDGVENVTFFSKDMLENITFTRCQSRVYEMQTVDYIYSQEKIFKRNLTIQSARSFEELFQDML